MDSIVVHRLTSGFYLRGYRVVIGGDKLDIDVPNYRKLEGRLKHNSKVKLVTGKNIPVELQGNTYVSKDEKGVNEVTYFSDLAYIFSMYGIDLYKYKVIDRNTYETVITTDDKEEVTEAVKEWSKNNENCLITIYEDGECVYP